MQKYPCITVFTNKKGKFIVPHVPFQKQTDMCSVFGAGLSRANSNEIRLINREEEGTEKIVIIFDEENKKFEIESTVDRINTIYVLSELIKKLIHKEPKNIELTFIIQNNEVFIVNHNSIDIADICAVTANSIQKIAEHHFTVATKEENETVIKIMTTNYGEPLIASTEDQKTTLAILIDMLINSIKLYK